MIINARQTISPRVPMGVGDTNLAVKWNFRQERGTSRWPALTMAFAAEVPTGDSSTQLGSGVFDYRLIAIAQKTLSPRIKLRVNQGLLFSGNTLTGVVGLGGRVSSTLPACRLCGDLLRDCPWASSSLVREPQAAGQAGQRCRSSSGANIKRQSV